MPQVYDSSARYYPVPISHTRGLVPQQNRTNFQGLASDAASKAIGAYSALDKGSKSETTPPGPTLGGALMSGVGGAAAGATAAGALGAEMGSAGGWWGIGAGFVLGVASYYLS